jgi:hypothetical protein
MFYYGVQSWGNQELLFVHQFRSLDNLCGYIKYIQRSYKVYLKPKNNTKGAVKNKNLLRLFKLIDDYKWSSLMFRTMDCLVPESDKILYMNSIPHLQRKV